MKSPILLVASATLFLAGCEGFDLGGSSVSGPFFKQLPEGVLEIVGPYQDLTAVKIDPIDNCYVYRHVGQVETTFLPLRAKNGRPICGAAPEAEADA